MRSPILFTLTLLLSFIHPSFSQERRYDYTGSLIAKMAPFSVTDAEVGFGLAMEYRAHRFLSVQMGMDYLSPLLQQSAKSGAGFRLRPEGRFYLPHRARRKTPGRFDTYAGLEFTVKYIHTNFGEWTRQEDKYGNTYQQYSAYSSTNFAFGPIFKLGFQWYPGKARKLVLDAVVGVGPVFNNIQLQNNGYPISDQRPLYDDGFSYNKYAGTAAYVNFDFRIGYRF